VAFRRVDCELPESSVDRPKPPTSEGCNDGRPSLHAARTTLTTTVSRGEPTKASSVGDNVDFHEALPRSYRSEPIEHMELARTSRG
jgi:hypothetical protein